MRRPSTVPAVLAGLAVLTSTACGADGAKHDSVAVPTGAATSAGPSASGPSPSPTRPEFTATDYRYVLVRTCRCAFLVPVTVMVRDGRVQSAVARESGGRGVNRGDPAPASHRLTVIDIIELAEDPSQNATVSWPAGQPWPDRVHTDPVPGARDDEVTYRIKNVRVR